MPFKFMSLTVIFLALAACTASAQAPARLAACLEGRAPYPEEITYPAPLMERLGEVPAITSSEFGDVIDGIAFPPPMPTYPIRAAIAGREGACLIYFDLDAAGAPQDVAAACTSAEFIAAAEAAVREARFPPAMIDGAPTPRERMVYPLTFCLMG